MGLLVLVILVLAFKSIWRPIKKMFTKPEFNGKLVWVTGASGGLGEEMTKRFARLGASVILSSRNVKELERVKNECENPEKHQIFAMDFSKPKEVMEKTQQFIKQLEQQGKKLDIVVENAGITQREKFVDTDLSNHIYMTELNYNGPVAHVKGFLPHMIKNNSGQLVVISSVAGKLTPAFRTSYCGAKHAISGFFDSLRAEVTDHNIAVTQIFPGYVQTNISRNAMVGKQGESFGKNDANIASGTKVEDFGDDAMFAIYTKEKDRVITNETKQIFASCIKQMFPDFVANSMHKNMKQQIDALKKAE